MSANDRELEEKYQEHCKECTSNDLNAVPKNEFMFDEGVKEGVDFKTRDYKNLLIRCLEWVEHESLRKEIESLKAENERLRHEYKVTSDFARDHYEKTVSKGEEDRLSYETIRLKDECIDRKNQVIDSLKKELEEVRGYNTDLAMTNQKLQEQCELLIEAAECRGDEDCDHCEAIRVCKPCQVEIDIIEALKIDHDYISKENQKLRSLCERAKLIMKETSTVGDVEQWLKDVGEA